MAIGTNAAVYFYGTPSVVTAAGGTSAVSSAAYSASGDVVSGGWTNTLDTPEAAFVLKFEFPSGTITTGGIQLYARLLNNDSTTDEPQPSTTWMGHILDSFSTGTGMSATTNYAVAIGPLPLPSTKSSQEYEFYVQNNCGVTMTAGWTLTIIQMAVGPKA